MSAIRIAFAAALLWLHALAVSSPVHIDYRSRGGDLWAVTLTVANEGFLRPIFEFSVYLPEAGYSSLALLDSPTGWDVLVLQPDASLPADGLIDGLALDADGAVGDGDWIDGLRFEFRLSKGWSPGALRYELLDRDFSLLDEGLGSYAILPPVLEVPEPSLRLLALAALVAAGTASRLSRKAIAQRR